MLSSHSSHPYPGLSSMKIEDFGQLQSRYQSLTLAGRAKAVLEDAEPALQAAEAILNTLNETKDKKAAFDRLRRNSMLIGRLRPSDAKVALMDSSCDFLAETLRKLATWRKTMERLSQGEAIGKSGNREYIRSDEPLALAIAGCSGISSYISIVQLALTEIGKLDSQNAKQYATMTAEIRRCATVLSDYENASAFQSMVH